MSNSPEHNSGFGLLELLVVVAIVVVLAVVVISNVGDKEKEVDDATSKPVTVEFVVPCSTIKAGSSETFTLLVVLKSAGGSTLDATGRDLTFSVKPSDGEPPKLTINISSGPAGASGVTQVVVTAQEDYRGPGTVTGTDTESGESAAAQFTVVDP